MQNSVSSAVKNETQKQQVITVTVEPCWPVGTSGVTRSGCCLLKASALLVGFYFVFCAFAFRAKM